MTNLKYEDVKNWEALKGIIKSNEYVLKVGACSLRKKDELIEQTKHLKTLLKRHEEERQNESKRFDENC